MSDIDTAVVTQNGRLEKRTLVSPGKRIIYFRRGAKDWFGNGDVAGR